MRSFENGYLESQAVTHGLAQSLRLIDEFKDSIEHLHGDFAVADLQEACPMVSIGLIRRILQERRKQGSVECLGRGPKARWRNT